MQLEVTALGQTGTGARVNLEPALSLGERLGGHLVGGADDQCNDKEGPWHVAAKDLLHLVLMVFLLICCILGFPAFGA